MRLILLIFFVAVFMVILASIIVDDTEKQCEAKGGFLVHSHTNDDLVCISKGAIIK